MYIENVKFCKTHGVQTVFVQEVYIKYFFKTIIYIQVNAFDGVELHHVGNQSVEIMTSTLKEFRGRDSLNRNFPQKQPVFMLNKKLMHDENIYNVDTLGKELVSDLNPFAKGVLIETRKCRRIPSGMILFQCINSAFRNDAVARAFLFGFFRCPAICPSCHLNQANFKSTFENLVFTPVMTETASLELVASLKDVESQGPNNSDEYTALLEKNKMRFLTPFYESIGPSLERRFCIDTFHLYLFYYSIILFLFVRFSEGLFGYIFDILEDQTQQSILEDPNLNDFLIDNSYMALLSKRISIVETSIYNVRNLPVFKSKSQWNSLSGTMKQLTFQYQSIFRINLYVLNSF